MNVYYTVDRELVYHDHNLNIGETTGRKTITIYVIDTKSMKLIKIAELEVKNDIISIDKVAWWVDEDEYYKDIEYELVKL